MAVTWTIRPEQELEQESIQKWGAAEWERRKAVCKKKKDELSKNNFEAGIIIGNQFDSIARVVDQERWDLLVELPVSKWERLVEKLILG